MSTKFCNLLHIGLKSSVLLKNIFIFSHICSMFIMYINDIISCLKYSKLALFADDTTIYITCDNLNSGIKQINEVKA